jgi:GNAT superfamily N-acetyltransferase
VTPGPSLSCDDRPVAFEIRLFAADDADDVITLALRAWEPVFDSLRAVLGPTLFVALEGEDWRPKQAADVRKTIEADHARTWVATVQGISQGFATASLAPGAELGEIAMIAVDPDHQRRGLASALTEAATVWLRDQGATTAMVDTGGDPGHAAARATYRRAGFTALPVMRYFKTL